MQEEDPASREGDHNPDNDAGELPADEFLTYVDGLLGGSDKLSNTSDAAGFDGAPLVALLATAFEISLEVF